MDEQRHLGRDSIDWDLAREALDSFSDEVVPDDVVEVDGHKVIRCWEHRGCVGLDGLTGPMSEECPHARKDCYSPCPAECKYTACRRAWHKTASGFDLVLDPTVDRRAAIKQICYTCEHFLKEGPRIDEHATDGLYDPETATRESETNVTIHLF